MVGIGGEKLFYLFLGHPRIVSHLLRSIFGIVHHLAVLHKSSAQKLLRKEPLVHYCYPSPTKERGSTPSLLNSLCYRILSTMNGTSSLWEQCSMEKWRKHPSPLCSKPQPEPQAMCLEVLQFIPRTASVWPTYPQGPKTGPRTGKRTIPGQTLHCPSFLPGLLHKNSVQATLAKIKRQT